MSKLLFLYQAVEPLLSPNQPKSREFVQALLETNDVFGVAHHTYVYLRPIDLYSLVSTQRLLVEIIRVLKTDPPTISCLYYKLPGFCKTEVKSVDELRNLCKNHAKIVGEVLELPGESYECDKEDDETCYYDEMFSCIVNGISSIVGEQVLEKDENVTSNLPPEDFHENCQEVEEADEVKEAPIGNVQFYLTS